MTPQEQADKVKGIMGTQNVVTVFGCNIDMKILEALSTKSTYYVACHKFVQDCQHKERLGFKLSPKQNDWLHKIEEKHLSDC